MVKVLFHLAAGPDHWQVADASFPGLAALELVDASHMIEVGVAFYPPELTQRLVRADVDYRRGDVVSALQALNGLTFTVVQIANRMGFDPLILNSIGFRPQIRLETDAVGENLNRPYTLQSTVGLLGQDYRDEETQVVGEIFTPLHQFNLDISFTEYLQILEVLAKIAG